MKTTKSRKSPPIACTKARKSPSAARKPRSAPRKPLSELIPRADVLTAAGALYSAGQELCRAGLKGTGGVFLACADSLWRLVVLADREELWGTL